MLSPPLTPPASDPITACSEAGLSSSRPGSSSSSARRRGVRFSLWTGYSDDDDDDDSGSDNGLRERRSKVPKLGTSPRRRRQEKGNGALLLTPTKSPISPSRFIVRGNVTPSRAAPLFRVTSKPRRVVRRRKDESSIFWDDSDEENGTEMAESSMKEERILAVPNSFSPCKMRAQVRHESHSIRAPLAALSINAAGRNQALSHATPSQVQSQRPSQFVVPSYRAAQPRSLVTARTSMLNTIGTTSSPASYMLAMKSNSRRPFGQMPSNLASTVSTRDRWNRLCNTATPLLDFFTLPSRKVGGTLSQPISSNYANSARSVDHGDAQWLAVGNNEGTVSLFKTPSGTELEDEEDDAQAPFIQTDNSTVFELEWRHDDELLAVGYSNFTIDIVDTSTLQSRTSLSGMRGCSRSIRWDPTSCGNVLASGGRDGAIHIYDLRVDSRANDQERADQSPVLSIWSAHALTRPARTKAGSRAKKNDYAFRGVTGVAFMPGRGSNTLCSTGCGDGVVKLWDLRSVAQACGVDLYGERGPAAEDFLRSAKTVKSLDSFALASSELDSTCDVDVSPVDQSRDVTLQTLQNKSSHGISSIAVSSSEIFAASTDGCIYTLPCHDLFRGSSQYYDRISNLPLYDAEQRGNTLYSKLALNNDERTLALGNSKGSITVWDTKAARRALSELALYDSAPIPTPHFGIGCDSDLEALRDMARPSYLYGHEKKFEVSSVSWAYGYDGYSLASTSDDYTIRTWRPSTVKPQ